MIVTCEDVFLLDNWGCEDAMKYLAGIYELNTFDDDGKMYWHVLTLDFNSIMQDDLNAYEGITLQTRADRNLRIFKSGLHNLLNPPSYYIDWALSKKIDIPWLEWAIEKGYYTPKENKNSKEIAPPLHKRLENNYLRLIFALANGVKGFNPNNPYESARLIIDETSIKLSQDTIADYISRAYELSSKEKD